MGRALARSVWRENVNTNEESGVTNRPIEEEQREQQNLPPRGDRKDGTHA